MLQHLLYLLLLSLNTRGENADFWNWNDKSLFFFSKGWPRLIWFVIDGKHLAKPTKDWHPQVRDASAEIAYIEVIQYNILNLQLFCYSLS